MNNANGLAAQIKNKIIQDSLDRRQRQADREAKNVRASVLQSLVGHTGKSNASANAGVHENTISPAFYRFEDHPGYEKIRIMNDMAAKQGVANPYFKAHQGVAGALSIIGNKSYINFSSYNYLGFSGDAEISQAAKNAIDQYGTSVSASRVVSGERTIHRELERAIADTYAVDDAIVFVSGHATNVSTIGYLFTGRDLIVHDAFIHNSALQGIQLSGATRIPFQHNDWQALDQILCEQRAKFERVLIIIEGIYSMDGDYPDLPQFVALKKKHLCFLMVDEAHSFGVMGVTGMGIREHFNLPGDAVDIWMGTLSKSLASCGGYIAGKTALIENLKFLSPGFLYSVGISPPLAAASLAALQKLKREPNRVAALRERGQQFLSEARLAGIDTGVSSGHAVVPAIYGSSLKAAKISAMLFHRGINAQPILYPAVPEKSARLRFFISCEHTPAQITETIAALADAALLT